MKTVAFLLFLVCLVSCSKKNDQDAAVYCPEFVKTNVIAGIRNTATVEEVFAFFNTLQLRIDMMSGFFYASPYPVDSIFSLKAQFSQKAYINKGGFTPSVWAHYQTGVVQVTNLLWHMDVANQQDWIAIKNALNLSDTHGDTKNVLLIVPEGREKEWAATLRQSNLVKWTELNCKVRVLFN